MAIRKDPVQFRVAIPAADPPGNIMHDTNLASVWTRMRLMQKSTLPP